MSVNKNNFAVVDAYSKEKAREAAKALREEQEQHYAKLVEESKSNALVEEKRREKLLAEYDHKVSVIGLKRVLSTIVERSLLLDIDEMRKLSESYLEDIGTTIESFLESINFAKIKITDKNRNILEFIVNSMPSKENGYLLTESELDEEFGKKPLDQIEKDIDSLGIDVMDRVAEIVEDSKTKSEDISANLAALSESHSRHRYFRVNNILEALTLTESREMVLHNEAYNRELALAKAITYITVLETLDLSGVVSIGETGYDRIISLANNAEKKYRINESNRDREIRGNIAEDIKKRKSNIKESVDTFNSINDKSYASLKSDYIIESNTTYTEATSPSALNEGPASLIYRDQEGTLINESQVKGILESLGYNEEDFNTYGLDYLAGVNELKA